MTSRIQGFENPPYGFNFQWCYTWESGRLPMGPDKKALEFLNHHGFNFARIPCDYRFWTLDDPEYKFTEEVFAPIDEYLEACRQYRIHMSLNIHRAPGYCINFNHIERHNLWLDPIAQDAFIALWCHFAERYKGVSSQHLSFDLLNEPPDIGQYGMTRQVHEDLMRRVIAAIREIDPDRTIVCNGLGGGNIAIPELSDLNIVMSGRGYQPMSVSHFMASWWAGSNGMPDPKYPGCEYDGIIWDRQAIWEYYKPWRDLADSGVQVHIGEFGCYEYTPQHVAIAWFRDLFSIYRELGWGYSLWCFEGAFGIIGHNRPGARFETYQGYRVDRDLLDLMLMSRGVGAN